MLASREQWTFGWSGADRQHHNLP